MNANVSRGASTRAVHHIVMVAAVLGLLLVLSACGAERDASAVKRDAARVDPLRAAPAYAAELTGDDEEEEGALVSTILKGLGQGALGQIGGNAYGMILTELGFGKSGDAAQLKAMDAKLDQIIAAIDELKSDLAQLATEIKIGEDEIIANSNDPSAAMDRIDTFTTSLQILSDGRDPGTVPAADVATFANNVENDYAIRTDVDAIRDAILPLDNVKKPVLGNYVDLLVAQHVDLEQGYVALEQYFVNLVYYQTQGVSLVVEALNAKAAQAGATPDLQAAAYYKKFETETLPAEVKDFMDNTWQLVLSQVDVSDPGNLFLPSEAPAILARAHFIQTQLLTLDHFGLRADVVVTQDKAGAVTTATATAPGGKVYKATASLVTCQGPTTYEYWKGTTVSPSTSYQVADFDFGALPAGAYQVVAGDGSSLGTVTVAAYTDGYVADPAGADVYGYGQTTTHIVNGFATMAKTTDKHSGSGCDYAADDKAGTLEISPTDTDSDTWSYNGSSEMDVDFVYGGTSARAVTVTCPAIAAGYVSGAANPYKGATVDGTLAGGIVVYDVTANQAADSKNASYSWSAKLVPFWTKVSWTTGKALAFTAQPGHSYEVRFTLGIKGDNSGADLHFKNVVGMQMRF